MTAPVVAAVNTRNAVSSVLLCSLLAATMSVRSAAGFSSPMVPQEDSLKGYLDMDDYYDPGAAAAAADDFEESERVRRGGQVDHFLRGRRDPTAVVERMMRDASFNHLMRGKKASASFNHLLRGKKSFDHLMRGKKSVDHYLRGRRAEDFKRILRAGNFNHLMRGKRSGEIVN